MSNTASRLAGGLCLLALLALPVALPLRAEDEAVLYASHFERESDLAKWAGRPGFGKDAPKLATASEGAREAGKPYLSVMTDGKIGSGLRLKPLPLAKPGATCVLSFWFRNEGRFPVTYHLTGAAQGSNGEASGAWHPLAGNGWTQVSYAFLPTGESVGLEIAAGVEEYEPAKIAVYDVQLKQ